MNTPSSSMREVLIIAFALATMSIALANTGTPSEEVRDTQAASRHDEVAEGTFRLNLTGGGTGGVNDHLVLN